jgi:hypothetical protein
VWSCAPEQRFPLSSGKAVKGINRRFALATAGLALALALLAIAAGIHAGGRAAGTGTPSGPMGPAMAQAMGLPGPVLLPRAPARIAAGTRPAARAGNARPAPRAATARPVRRASTARPVRRAATALTGDARSGHHSPRQVARSLLRRFGWQPSQFSYLDLLWAHESGWNRYASNPNSGAYGIPQAVPGSAMASAGPDWRWNARTQILWGMRYIRGRYGSPYGAWQHECSSGWY